MLDSKACLSNCTPKGYKGFHTQRRGATKSGGGGIAIIVKSNFFSCKKQFVKHNVNSFEFLALEVISKRNTIPKLIVAIYRPPGKSISAGFLSEFSNFCEIIKDKYGNNIVFTGDFNIHMNNLGENSAWKFADLLNDLGLLNHIDVPTFKRSSNVLDLVIDSYTNPLVFETNVKPDCSISDHHLITFKLKIEREEIIKVNKVINFREYKNRSNTEKCINYIENAYKGFSEMYNVGSLAAQLYRIFAVILSYFPSTSKTIRVSETNPWYNSDCNRQKLALRSAERKYLASLRKHTCKTVINERQRNRTRLKTQKNEYARVLKNAKRDYYSSIFSAASHNPKKTYKVISELLGNETTTHLPDLATVNPQMFVDNFCEYLSNKIKNIHHCIEKKEVLKKVYAQVINYLPVNKFSPMSSTEFDKVLKDCNKTFCSLDTVDFRKFEINHLKPYFLKLTNSMFESGTFPKSEKSAVITPLLKDLSGDLNKFDNYRGISKIPMSSKILEYCIYLRMQEYIEANDILPQFQSAYRSGFSTETAMVKTYNDLIITKDAGRCTAMLCLDLSAAFDTIEHDLLIADLFQIGFRGSALDLISEYLRGRTFTVHANKHTSASRPLLFGVPQGSTLGPLLFTLYIRSLPKVFENLNVKYHTYADDTIIYFDFDPKDIVEVNARLHTIMSKVTEWMNSRRLKINVDKTKLIFFPTASSKNFINENYDCFDFQGQNIQPSSEVKILGFTLDSSLNLRAHINSVIKKCNFAIYNLKHIRDFIPRKLFITVVQSEILSRIDYCNALYINLPKSELNRLQLIINKAVRLIFSLPRSASITPYLKNRLHWLPIGPRVDFKVLLLAKKANESNRPGYLKELIVPTGSRRGLFAVPRIEGRHSFAMRAFKHNAPALLNKIPIDIRECSSIESFKKKLKSYLYIEGFVYKLDSILNYTPSDSIYTYRI